MTGWSCQEAQGKPLKEVFQIIDGPTREPSTNHMELAIETRKTVGLSAKDLLYCYPQMDSQKQRTSRRRHGSNPRPYTVTTCVKSFHEKAG
jgi:hypothetical protein